MRASSRIALYSVRNARGFCGEPNYIPVFRRFLDMSFLEPSFGSEGLTENRSLLLEQRVGRSLLELVELADDITRCRYERVMVDGTGIEAPASLRGLKPWGWRTTRHHGR